MHTKYADKNFFIHNILYIKFLKKILLRTIRVISDALFETILTLKNNLSFFYCKNLVKRFYVKFLHEKSCLMF